MRTFRGSWALAGVVAGLAGLATSYVVASLMSIRESPVVAVAELVIRVTPGRLAEFLISVVGKLDKPLLVLGILVVLFLAFAWAGLLARRSWWAPAVVYAALAAVAAIGVATQRGAVATDQLPVLVGFVTWLVTLSALTEPLRRAELDAATAVPIGEAGPVSDETRRGFLLRAGVVAGAALVLGFAGRVLGRGRRQVEESRRLLRLEKVSLPEVPDGSVLDVREITPWMTPNDSFYLIDTAIVKPAIEPRDWSLRIHGMVERELTLSFQDLLDREFTEAWITLNCVSNEVGGTLIGNAWWSGVLLAEILAEAGPDAGADAVLQTSEYGWDCATPLSALTDGRDAMLAVAMNGKPLPIEHGFPVRTIVPGLYGYVSACKWVVDMEVTRFEDVSAYWTERGWTELGPVKMASRVDVPRQGDDLDAGEVRVAGVAWMQHTGINKVEFQVDAGDWQTAELAGVPNVDTWVQWTGVATVDESGEHHVRVRATDADGNVQIEDDQGVFPDGSTGYHRVDFNVS